MYDSDPNSSVAGNRIDVVDNPPTASSTKHKGWAGEDMEMQHQRECYLKRQKQSCSGAATFTAVDLNQFRNTEVGRGYQAKGVVRQRSGVRDYVDGGNCLLIKDLTQKSGDANSGVVEGKGGMQKSQRRKRNIKGDQDTSSKSSLTNAYLHSQGIRDFRKELDKILNEANSM